MLALVACQGKPGAASSGPEVTLKRASVAQNPVTQGSEDVAAPGRGSCLPDAPRVPKAPAPPFALSGRLGLWVAQVDPVTLNVIRAVGTNPDSEFPLASTYKQAVLWALLKKFDQGEVSPTERFDVTRSNQSLGAYPFDGTTIRDLSTRMIRDSDNTATDIIHRRVGLQSVQDIADHLGLCRSRLIMPTRNWWVMEAGLSDTFNGTGRWVTATGEERTRLAALIDEDARQYRSDFIQRKLDGYFDHRYQPTDDLKTHNLSTPYEFSTLLAHEYLNPGLSARAVKWQRDVAQKGFGRYALKAQAAGNVAWFGGKGGNGWRILTYSGYFQTKDGRHVVYTFMQHGANETYTMPNTRRAFAWINAGIDAVIGVQTPRPKVTVPKETVRPGSDAARAKAAAVKGAAKPLPNPPHP
ncbi:serine hydrolase [Deinococcus cavernae]|uniref:Serine hydrolase n=1 Tax=Deinococcus cavernae TaxID=2320857 RepID=A0A418VA56_9DEIO|nr:serine hydrolase [Deinococcus cavernae]RJF72959.1 serine hydrolase [Deinococcus cavernae]